MKRKKAERKIIKHLKEIEKVMKEYNPDADYLSICIRSKDGILRANNEYWAEDADKPIDFFCWNGEYESESAE